MKTSQTLRKGMAIVALLLVAAARWLDAQTPGIPEPPLVLFGTVTNASNSQPVVISSVSWQASDGTTSQNFSASSLPPTRIVSAGGHSYYMLEAPFDTRVVQDGADQIALTPATNSFDLKPSSPTYTLTAVVNGLAATIKAVNGVAQPPGTASYSINDYTPDTQGRMIQVDLWINVDPYLTWAAQYFNDLDDPDAAKTADPDGDGLNNEREFLAGTNPIVATRVTIASVPPHGSNGVMQGVVTGVDFSAFRVAPYIYIDGLGWFTKPTQAAPTVAINPDGTFTANVTTGGIDNLATIFCAALVPVGYTPPFASGNRRVPADLNSSVIDFKERYGRTIVFANRTWAVKEAPVPVGPGVGLGLNRFSKEASDVWVDGDGLHLTIRFHDGQWWATEVILLDKLGGYGTYAFKTRSRTDIMDKNATFGMFTWDAYGDDETWSSYPEADLVATGSPHQREIDFEDSRWGNASDPNTQSVVQPWGRPVDNRHRYSLPDLSADASLTRFFTWTHDAIDFVALIGNQSPASYPPGSVFNSRTYVHDPSSEHYVLVPGRERVHLNLWLNQNSATPAPSDGQPVEVVITDFSFTPASGRSSIQFNASSYSVSEGATNVVITATRTGDSQGAVSVNYEAGNGTATAPADFAATSGVLTWADGDMSDKSFQVPIASDPDYEGSETVILALSSPTGGAAMGAPSTVTLTIVDDDPMPVPEIVVEQPAGAGLTDGVADVAFGNVNVGSTGSLTFTIKNSGTANLTGLAVTKDGVHAGDFTVNTTGMSTSVAPNGSTTFTVTFGPSAPGSRSAAIHIASNDTDENPFDIALAGTGIASRIVTGTTAAKPTWRRPDQNGANPPVALSATATAVPFEAISFKVGAAGTYTFTSTAVSPSGWDNFLVLYADAFSATAQLANVLIGNDDFPGVGTSGFSIDLVAGTTYYAVSTGHGNSNAGVYSLVISGPGGIAVGPEIAVEQPAGMDLVDGKATIPFGVVNAGSTSGALTFTIRSVGTANLSGIAVTKTGANAGDFVVSTTGMSTTLAPSGNTTFTVRFAPTGGGAKTATLRIASNDTDENPFDIALTGTGFVPVPGTLAVGGALFTVAEETGTVNIPITRTGGTDGAVSVLISTSNGTATAGGDYTAVTGQQVSFAAGDGATKNVAITILNPAGTNELSETFTVTLSSPTGGATLGAQKTATVVILDSVDTTKPGTPTITAPLAGAKLNVNPGGAVTVTGSATDNQRVAGVEVSLNGGSFVPAGVTLTGAGVAYGKTATYSVDVIPATGGGNTVQVRTTDLHGSVSAAPATRAFTVLRPLGVNFGGTGSGTVTAGFAPTSFREIGKSYTITATPKPGFVFDGWTVSGGPSLSEIAVTDGARELPTLTFVFREGLVLTASFIANPFVAAVTGAFNGLIMPSASLPAPGGTVPSNETVGKVTATVSGTGAFSGTLYIDGRSLGFSGVFDNIGTGRFGTNRATMFTVVRTTKPSYELTLHLDLAPAGTNKMTGTLTQRLRSAAKTVSMLDADRASYNGTTIKVPANLAGTASKRYTVVFPAKATQGPAFSSADYPQGDGYATVTVYTNGTVSVAGKLADGTAISASAPLSKSNSWPLFQALYPVSGVTKGCIAGQIALDDAQTESDMAGANLHWFRPFQLVQWYPYGWDEGVLVDLIGAKYVVPPATPATSVFPGPGPASPLKAVDLVNGNVGATFSDGMLDGGSVVRNVNISSTNVATKPTSNTDANFSLVITPGSGVVTGTFTHMDNTNTVTKPTFQGVIIQKGTQRGAYGYFLTKQPAVIDYKGESGGVSLFGLGP